MLKAGKNAGQLDLNLIGRFPGFFLESQKFRKFQYQPLLNKLFQF